MEISDAKHREAAENVGAVSACVLTPFPPNKHAGEAFWKKAE